jgi:hypothetical protein
MKPEDAYRAGYEKGRKDNLADNVEEAALGMLRDDPGGYYAAGHYDGARGKPFKPHSEGPPTEAELNPFDDKVAIKTVCPNCGSVGWFEWKFLGKLVHPVCGYTWYAGSGTYALMQIRAAFQAGSRFSKYWTSGIHGEGAWIAKAVGWFMGTLLGIGIRLEFGLLMTPIQATVGLCQRNQVRSERLSRCIILSLFFAFCAIAIYQIQHAAIGGSSGLSQTRVLDPVRDVTWVRDSPLLKPFGRPRDQFGIAPIHLFATRPDIVNRLHMISPSFDIRSFSDSLGVFVARLSDGRQLLTMAGCPPHMCGGIRAAAAVEHASGKCFCWKLELTQTVPKHVCSLGEMTRSYEVFSCILKRMKAECLTA